MRKKDFVWVSWSAVVTIAINFEVRYKRQHLYENVKEKHGTSYKI